jgi:hypothetical protein
MSIILEGVDELVLAAGATGLGTDELDAKAAPVVGQDLCDGAESVDVPNQVFLEGTVVRCRRAPGSGAIASQLASQRGQRGEGREVLLPLFLLSLPTHGRSPLPGEHASLGKDVFDIVQVVAGHQVSDLPDTHVDPAKATQSGQFDGLFQ